MRKTFFCLAIVFAGVMTGDIYIKRAWALPAGGFIGTGLARGHFGAVHVFDHLLATPPWPEKRQLPDRARDNQSSQIYNLRTNLCLEPAAYFAGAAVLQNPCNDDFAQQWIPLQVGSSNIMYQNQDDSYPALYLDARGGPANGTPVQVWTYGKITNEYWQPGKLDPDGFPPLISRVSGTSNYCLDVPGGQTTPGLAMQIYRCNGTTSQEWYIAAPILGVPKRP